MPVLLSIALHPPVQAEETANKTLKHLILKTNMAYDSFGKETPLLVSSSPFNYGNRPNRDRFWRNFYFMLLSASLGGALYSLINR